MFFIPNEILFCILTELYEMNESLFSCILVSRLWVKIVIPILWQDPFKHYNINNKSIKQIESLIYVFYQNLDDEERFILKDNLIFKDWMNIPTLFSYIHKEWLNIGYPRLLPHLQQKISSPTPQVNFCDVTMFAESDRWVYCITSP